MKKVKIYKQLSGALAALILGVTVPSIASAVPISVSGKIDTAFNLFGGSPPFSVGDPVSGSFNLDVGPDNSFDFGNTVTNPVGGLSNFNLTVGPATFKLGTSDFTEVSGHLSADGSKLEQLFLDSYPMDVGLDKDYGLEVQGPPDLLYVTNGGIIHAPITTTVGAASQQVPEPDSWALFGLAAAVLVGVSLRRQRSWASNRAA